MAAQQGIVRFHQDPHKVLLQVEGWGTMHHSLPLRRFVEQNLPMPLPPGPEGKKVWVDLRRCTYMDSTFVGTLLYLQRAAVRLGAGEFRLISPSPQCTSVLQSMGLIGLFQTVVMEEAAPSDWTTLCREPEDKRCFQRNVIQAHEELASLPGPAGEPFRAVVRCLAKELEKNPPEQAAEQAVAEPDGTSDTLKIE